MSRRLIRRKIKLDDAEPSQRVIRAYIRRLPKNSDCLGAYVMAAGVGFSAAFGCAWSSLFLGIALFQLWPVVVGVSAVVLPMVAVASARFYLARNDDFAAGAVYLSHWSTAEKPKLPCGKINDGWLCWRLGCYNYRKLYSSVSPDWLEWEDRKGRRELRRLCEAATVQLLRLDIVGIGPDGLTPAAKEQLDRDYGRAKQLAEALRNAPARRKAAAQAQTEMRSRPARELAAAAQEEAKSAALAALAARHAQTELIGDEPALADTIIAGAAAQDALTAFMKNYSV
jgi:hypothetical protein